MNSDNNSLVTFEEFLNNSKLCSEANIIGYIPLKPNGSIKFEAEFFYGMFTILQYQTLIKDKQHGEQGLRHIKKLLQTRNIMLCVRSITPYEFGFWMEMLEKGILDIFLDLENYDNLRNVYTQYKKQNATNWSEFLVKSYFPIT